jgi:hypothetical protein
MVYAYISSCIGISHMESTGAYIYATGTDHRQVYKKVTLMVKSEKSLFSSADFF